VGGLGAFGGFVIPPVMGVVVREQGDIGYAWGFVIFIALAMLSLALAYVLKLTHVMQEVPSVSTTGSSPSLR